MIRDRLSGDLKAAVNSDDPERTATLRLICAAVKDRDLCTQRGDSDTGVSEAEILDILAKMINQRETSARDYEEAGQLDLARQERKEIKILREYLPRPFTDREVSQAISRAIDETGASSVRDINRVMAHLKEKHSGRMDFSNACSRVKNAFR